MEEKKNPLCKQTLKKIMGCGSAHAYAQTDIDEYLRKNQFRSPSPELVDGKIKLTSDNGFFNSNPLLDSTWLQGKITNKEYQQAIEHINQRVAQTMVGASKSLSVDEIPKVQSTKLAIDELNEKFLTKMKFSYVNETEHETMNRHRSFVLIEVQ